MNELLPDERLSPRKSFRGKISKSDSQDETTLRLYFIDSDKESKIGIEWPFPKLKANQCLISQETANSNEFNIGDEIMINTQMERTISAISHRFYESTKQDVEWLSQKDIPLKCEIVGMLNKTYGKFGKNKLNKVVIMEFETLPKLINDGVQSVIGKRNLGETNEYTELYKFIENLSPYEYVHYMIYTFPEPRLSRYSTSDFNSLSAGAVSFMQNISDHLGYYPLKISMPIMEQMKKFNIAILFMGLIFSMILALFVVISIILIYSLLMVSVQQKSFDIGIKRMVGETKTELISDVLIQTFSFSIPGMILAYIGVFPVLGAIYYYEFEVKLGLKLDPNPTQTAIINAIILGIFIPIVSALVPIKECLSKNLNDALDYTRSQSKAEIIHIIDPNQTNAGIYIIFGLLSTVYAVAVYILMPQCLLSLDLGMMLKIFFLILIGLLLGLVLITLNIQSIIQILVTKLLFFWEHKAIQILILKNLIAHKLRNYSTALVYALSLSFLIL